MIIGHRLRGPRTLSLERRYFFKWSRIVSLYTCFSDKNFAVCVHIRLSHVFSSSSDYIPVTVASGDLPELLIPV